MFIRGVSKIGYHPTHIGELDYEGIRNSGLGWLRLDIDVPADIILRELMQATHLFVEHRDGYDSQGWRSFCLHGRSATETREAEHYAMHKALDWTPEALELMPETVEWLKTQWPHGSYHRVRMMELLPGGWIGVHQDTKSQQLGPINIAITQPEGCAFYSEGLGQVPFSIGSAMWMDVGRKHAVINRSDHPRWHMIIHQEENEDWKRLVERSYAKLAEIS